MRLESGWAARRNLEVATGLRFDSWRAAPIMAGCVHTWHARRLLALAMPAGAVQAWTSPQEPRCLLAQQADTAIGPPAPR